MILLDTNVVSELMRERPDPAVRAWFQQYPQIEVWTTSVVIAEMLAGIETMPAGRKQKTLHEAIEGMILSDFRGQILPFNLPAARRYAQILAARRKMGRPIREMDAQIAAIASVHGATLVTRDVNDFANCNLTVVNPWEKHAQP
ncbi:MAG: type II toxin-antitoxin system VapC family toxin [Terracidiphilus sp.]|nr:type II toxin-antitoxin system VapC family toxin [Terracidiphilus sp.]MDR3799036.1 type II toxin-antitoxin system VapC family toxin [Terracidiphilus sp.]